jgi:Domain of unknown function (DUF4136)
MKRLTRLTSVTAVVLAALALTGCATLRVNSYADKRIELRQYRSYAWAPRAGLSTGDPRLDNNRFFSQRVEHVADLQLAAKGFEKATASRADLQIHIHARVDRRVGAAGATTLVLDFIDRRTNALAWRGWAEGIPDAVIDDQDWMYATIDEAVAKILARLPRKESGS